MATKETLFNVRNVVADQLVEWESMFRVPMNLTFIARNPSNDEQDILISNDTLKGLRELIDRSEKREEQ